MSTFIVNSASALNSALHSAHAGDVIDLAPGTYSSLLIKNLHAGGITITSQSAAHEAVITGLEIDNSSGLNFNTLEFSFPLGDGSATPHGIMVKASQDIHFLSDNIHGVLNGDPTNDMTGIGFSQSSNVSVENSELQELRTGLTIGKSDHVTISGNNIHDLRIDGIEGMADAAITITDNTFSNFHHLGLVGSGGDHSDAIQFWTTNQTKGSSDVTITNNVIVQGAGRDMQGIFIQDSGGQLPYQHVTVTGNLIVGGNWNGIMIDHAQGLVLSDNTVATLTSETQTPWIKVMNSSGAVLSNNSAKAFALSHDNANLTESGDKISTSLNDGGQSLLGAWLGQHSHIVAMGPQTPAELVHPSASIALSSGGPASDPTDTAQASDTWVAAAPDSALTGDSSADTSTPPPAASTTPTLSTAADGHAASDSPGGYSWASTYGSDFYSGWWSMAGSYPSSSSPSISSADPSSTALLSPAASDPTSASGDGSYAFGDGSGLGTPATTTSPFEPTSAPQDPTDGVHGHALSTWAPSAGSWSLSALLGLHAADLAGMGWGGFGG